MKKQKNTTKKEIEFKVVRIPFFNQGIQYLLQVKVPTTVPDYRVKELFNLHFIGKGKDLRYDYDIFASLNGTYTVKPVKE